MQNYTDIKPGNLFQKFIRLESAGGIVMLGAAFAAMFLANSPLMYSYNGLVSYVFWEDISVRSFVKDVLMVAFFLVIGLELKKELVSGLLSRRDQIILPLVCAFAGMVVPAIIYYMLNADILATKRGWAIPSATDIAFALCVLTIFGRSVPASIKIFLLAIAIFDDLGAILIIAFFYSNGITGIYIGLSAIVIALLYILNLNRVSSLWPYIINGSVLCLLFHHAGIHSTVAGVITGLLVPVAVKNEKPSAQVRLLSIFHPWVAFLILPLFAFVSAGISFSGLDLNMLKGPVTSGVMLGLFVGKQVGIFGTAYIFIKTKLVSMPENAKWSDIYAVSVLAGIGFTMSLFISQLAFTDAGFQNEAKLGIIAGSMLSAVAGAIILKITRRR